MGRSVQLSLTPLSSSVSQKPPKVAPRAPGRILPHRFGRYTLFDHIGRGGMADIYLARAESGLGATRLVVIKEVLPHLTANTRFAEMLVSEAKLASLLSHANIVKVEELGREDGTLFIAMEYVEGLDLREVLRRCAKTKTPLPIEFSLRMVIEALRGLDHAHKKRGPEGQRLGIVHRDVSPSNVLLSFEGEVKLCDFGIARANALVETLPEEAIQGKAGYMSPEQARGDALDARADVFAAGIILWELLAGRKLYKPKDGEGLLALARRAEIPALVPRGLPHEERLHQIVARALEPERERRYPGAATMLVELEEYAALARMVASPIRFGEWFTEHFGSDIMTTRRARERVARALARGPAATLLPISPGGSDRLEEERPPGEDCTPSSFFVVERVDPEPTPRPALELPKVDAASETPMTARTVAKKKKKKGSTPKPPRAIAKAEVVAPTAPAKRGSSTGYVNVLALLLLAAAVIYAVLR